MDTRRWFKLAAVLVLGVLIGYGVARSAPSGVSARRYTVGQFGKHSFYRYDTHTGKTWYTFTSEQWKEIAEPN